ncbi:putative RNA-binding protein 19 [Nymphon striatum]|nr:putative RNA-binding protein 19 [Nymphon striatum]
MSNNLGEEEELHDDIAPPPPPSSFNLNGNIKEKRLLKLFNDKGGTITDIQLKYGKDGTFRQFAFIGFTKIEQATEAINHFNGTFIDTSKITVELCSEFGDADKPKSWSKHSKKASNNQNESQIKNKSDKKKNEIEKKVSMVNEGDLKNDPQFKEFMKIHHDVNDQRIWGNDEGINADSDSDDEDEDDKSDEENENDKSDEENENDTSVVKNNGISDLEYLKSKTVDNAKEDRDETTPKKTVKQNDLELEYTVKLRNLPYKCKKKDIKAFFGKFKPKSLRLPPKVKGIAYAMFTTKKGFDAAMTKHRSIIDGHRVDVVKYQQKKPETAVKVVKEEKMLKPWEKQSKDDPNELETIAESGRLFIRNLSYTCTEDDLEELFKTYGLLSEVNLPIDRFTRKIKGFGFITYVMPEDAVKACAELDGHSFQGRLLHILPSKIKTVHEKTTVHENGEEGSFKKNKAKDVKASSSSSHNWNALFLGANAVVDVMSQKYDTAKSNILDTFAGFNHENPGFKKLCKTISQLIVFMMVAYQNNAEKVNINDKYDKKKFQVLGSIVEGRGSVAVRVALGETQIVNETRDFLVKNGINLDEFSRPASERSKVVIIVKNLPVRTKTKELRSLFEKHGVVKNVLFPPAGITAIVEMDDPSEARAAFKRLAYSKFNYAPLYLEWAPMKVFNEDRKVVEEKVDKIEVQEVHENVEEEEIPDDNANIFIKNLNFETSEDTLKEHFKSIGKIHSVTIMKKRKAEDMKQLSMGYGFVQFMNKEDATRAIKELQLTLVDDHAIELKLSIRATQSSQNSSVRKNQVVTKQKSAKILVRNVPFEAKRQELEELFKVFGELKFVRLPKKLTGQHRGFAFVEFSTKTDAEKAFKALCHSTHLYGRRLVLEWADTEEDIDAIRKKSAQQFLEGGPKNKTFKKAVVEENDLVSSAQNRFDGNDDNDDNDDDGEYGE